MTKKIQPPTQEELMKAFFAVAVPMSPTTDNEILQRMKDMGAPQSALDDAKKISEME